MGTIERAYLLLEADGIVATRGRAGTFVVGRPAPGTHDAEAAAADLAAAAEALAVMARQVGATDDDALAALRSSTASADGLLFVGPVDSGAL